MNFTSQGTSFYQRDTNEQIGNLGKRADLNKETENLLPSIAPIKTPVAH